MERLVYAGSPPQLKKSAEDQGEVRMKWYSWLSLVWFLIELSSVGICFVDGSAIYCGNIQIAFFVKIVLCPLNYGTNHFVSVKLWHQP